MLTNFKNLSIEDLIKLRAEIDNTINEKKASAYKEGVADVIKAVEKIAKTNPYDTAFEIEIDYDDRYYCYDWKDLLDALKNK